MTNLYKNMRLLTSLFFLLTLCVFTSCDSDTEEELVSNWIRKAEFSGVARTGAVAFTINGNAYVSTGFNGESRLSDLWQYDAAQDTWTRKADFPGVGRSGAVSFVVNGRGYVGTGYNGTENLKDFWEYDPETDTWTQIADFPGTARYGAVAMALEDKGYIGAGFDGSYRKDFWQYDPATDTWTEKTELSGARRVNGYAFVINGKGYIGGGVNNGILEADLMEYSPATDTWRNLKNLTSTDRGSSNYPNPRAYATTFVLNNRAYLVGGSNGAAPSNSTSLGDVWEFDPATDTWSQVEQFNNTASREGAIGFSIGNSGYIGLGRSGANRQTNLWQFNRSGSGE